METYYFLKKRRFLILTAILSVLILDNCNIPKYTSIHSEQPSNYYMGKSRKVRVVNSKGATRDLQKLTVNELKSQSKKKGYFTIEDARTSGKDKVNRSNSIVIKFILVDDMKVDGETEVSECLNLLCTEKRYGY